MLTATQIEAYRKHGFLVVPEVIPLSQVTKARAKLAERTRIPPGTQGSAESRTRMRSTRSTHPFLTRRRSRTSSLNS